VFRVLISNHVLAGALIGRQTRWAPTAFALGFASHLAMDALPHWGVNDDRVYVRVARIDGVVGLALIGAALLTAQPRDRLPVAAAIFGACLPDTEQVSVHFFGRGFHPRWFDRLHGRIQHEHQWIGQEVVVGLGLSTLWWVGRPG
jgi:hypothetical protein